MKDQLLSTTSVQALLESWKQNNVAVPTLVETQMQEVRRLTKFEKTQLMLKYNGKPELPWYALFLDDEIVDVRDSLPDLLRDLKKAGYQLHISEVAA